MELIVPLAAAEAVDIGRFGPKAANLALLGRAGLPIPDGFCLDAEAYRIQVAASGLVRTARAVFSSEGPWARRCAVEMKLGLMEQPIVPAVRESLLAAWRGLTAGPDAPAVVRSSALVEDRAGSSFAGQFESFLGLGNEVEFLTAVRACWAALWSTRALRYMATQSLDPADTAMAVLMQPLVAARASGGGLSRTADGGMRVAATWGLGSAVAQGDVTPDRFELSRDGDLLEIVPGRKDHSVSCAHRQEPLAQRVVAERVDTPCLDPAQIEALGRMLRRVETIVGTPVEIEWALDEAGFKLLQARPLRVQPAPVPDEVWRNRPRLNGHPAGIGWGAGRACIVNCECELGRVAPGDVLVTRVAGPALGHVLTHVAGVVAELGGSTSHLAALARERGVPMVLGVLDATRRIPEGAQVAVDGIAGVVRWMR